MKYAAFLLAVTTVARFARTAETEEPEPEPVPRCSVGEGERCFEDSNLLQLTGKHAGGMLASDYNADGDGSEFPGLICPSVARKVRSKRELLKVGCCMKAHFQAFQEGIEFLKGHGVHNETMIRKFFCEPFDVRTWTFPDSQAFSNSKCESTNCPDDNNQRCWVTDMMRAGIEYNVNPLHDRHDAFAPSCPRSGEFYEAKWTRLTKMRRYLSQLNESFPPQVPVRTTQEYIDTVNTVLQADGGVFNLTSPRQMASIQNTIGSVDWNDVIIHAFAVPPAEDGSVYSPAFNSIWVVWEKTTHQLSHYMVIAANAEGEAQTKYIGNAFGTIFESITGYLYTGLTGSVNNPLHFNLPEYDPLNHRRSWLFDIWVWYEQHPPPEPWYLEVQTSMECTTDSSQFPVLSQIEAKEYYMTEIVMGYLPQAESFTSKASPELNAYMKSVLPWEAESCKKVDKLYRSLLEPMLGPEIRTMEGSSQELTWEISPQCVAPSA